MEDPSEEWEVYSPPGVSGNVNWVLNKGLGLGKKIVISGIVISAAPLVLPPLVVFSTLGLALSVPFGFFFTSYACTEKLMSKLLSTPTPSPMMEYDIFSSDEDEISDDDAHDFEEEERLKKNIKEGVEMRIELAEKGNEGFDQEGKLTEQENYQQGGVDGKEKESMEAPNEIVKEEGYEEDDEDLAEENVNPLGEIDMKMEGEMEDKNVGIVEEKRQPVMDESKDQKPVDELCGVVIVIEGDKENNINAEVGEPFEVTKGFHEENRVAGKAIDIEEGKKLVGETEGLKESIRDEGHTGIAVEDDKQRVRETCGATENRDKRNVGGNAKKMEKPSGSKKKKLIRKMGGAVKKKDEFEETKERRYEGNNGSSPKVAKLVGEIEEIPRSINGKHVGSIAEVEIPQEEKIEATNVGSAGEKEQKPKVDKKDDEISNKFEETKERQYEGNNGSSPKVAKPVGEIEGIQRSINGKHVGSIAEVEIPQEEKIEATNVGSAGEKEQKPKVDKKATQIGRTDDSIVNDVDGGFQMERAGEAVIISNADAREIADEIGIDLVDNKNTADEHYDSVMETAQGTGRLPSYMDEKIAANADHPISAGVPESPSGKGTTIPSDKAIYSEDKIWEIIRALRTIVGYRVAQQATCMEELKALYIFTGIEPPISFKNSSDLVEINDTLRFLMSVVGVK